MKILQIKSPLNSYIVEFNGSLYDSSGKKISHEVDCDDVIITEVSKVEMCNSMLYLLVYDIESYQNPIDNINISFTIGSNTLSNNRTNYGYNNGSFQLDVKNVNTSLPYLIRPKLLITSQVSDLYFDYMESIGLANCIKDKDTYTKYKMLTLNEQIEKAP